MKLTFLLSLLTFLQASAVGLAQNISLSEKNTPIEKIFKEIEKQSGYNFLYNTQVLRQAKPVSVEAKDASLEKVLEECFKAQPLTYTITDRTIVVKQREAVLQKPQARQADTLTVHGRVVAEETGKPLVGASVVVKGGGGRGANTDADGRFVLTVNTGDELLVMYLGFQPQEVAPGRGGITVAMKPSAVSMNEVSVIATGYQQVAREKLTGSVSSISQEQYDQRVSVTGNFLESLEGKVPGLLYNSQTGELAIRGVSTFDAVKKPLIVLNGFPTEIDIRSINPNDIISVNVLKDAAAASIYGTRASNGVIVIETKRGKAGKPVFSLRATYGLQPKQDLSYMRFSSAADYAQLERDYLLASGQTRASFPANVPASPVANVVYDFKAGLLEESEMNNRVKAIGAFDNQQQYESLFYRKGIARQVDFDVSGGNENNTYMLGVNYVDEQHQIIRTDDKRLLLNFASTHNFTDRIHFDFRGTYSNMEETSPFSDVGAIGYLNNFMPYERLADENGNALPVSMGPGRNPYEGITGANNELNQSIGLYDQLLYPYREAFASTNTVNTSFVRFQGRINTELNNWLSLDLGGAYEDQPSYTDQLQTEEAFSVRRLLNYTADKDATTGLPVFGDLPKGDFLTRTNERVQNYTLRGQFNLSHTSANQRHAISGILGTEVRKTAAAAYKNTFFGYNRQSLLVKPVNFAKLNAGKQPVFATLPANRRPTLGYTSYFGEKYDDRRFVSVYGNGTYTYNDRYVVTGSIRFDKSNLFGTDPKYRNKPFYSVGANWHLGKEGFMDGLGAVDELMLRAAYGLNGNIPTSNSGPFLLLQSDLNYYLLPAEEYNDILSPANQSIRWEQSKNLNFGADYSLFNSRLYGTVDVYLKNSVDVFGWYSADPTLGFNQYKANTASIRNEGLELSISSLNVQTGNFSWRTNLTASLNNNEVTAVKTTSSDIEGGALINASQIQKGYPIDALFAYRYAGLNELGQPEIFDKNGERKLLEIVGLGDENITLEDLQYTGTTTPRYILGLNNQFSVGNFDLSFLFMYYGGHVMRVEAPDPSRMGLSNGGGRVLEGAMDYWRQPGDEQRTNIPGFPVVNTPGYFDSYARGAYTYASDFVRKADHIRLRDIVLTYNLDSPYLTKLGLDKTQLRAQVQNAFNYTFSGNNIDPDAIDRQNGTRFLEQQPLFSLSLYTNF